MTKRKPTQKPALRPLAIIAAPILVQVTGGGPSSAGSSNVPWASTYWPV
jgi:hypothetical protein